MHPFGGTHICPRCSKVVYAAEQVMGPGRKLYHKPCLACTACNKRLDSYTLLEHDQKPYCKSCHVKDFGTRDLRQANLPDRHVITSSGGAPLQSHADYNILHPTSRGSPLHDESNADVDLTRTTISPSLSTTGVSATGTFTQPPPPNNDKVHPIEQSREGDDVSEASAKEERDVVDQYSPSAPSSPTSRNANPRSTGMSSNTGRPGFGGIPRTVPLTPVHNAIYGTSPAPSRHSISKSLGGTPTQTLGKSTFFGHAPAHHLPTVKPIMQTATGTRYGTALGGALPAQSTGNAGSLLKKWGVGDSNPCCPRCGKSVYFAEQVRAVGKIYHKNCLRCTECNTLLDSSRLRDHGGEPLCVRCYGKLHGPQGGGYALLGKAGG